MASYFTSCIMIPFGLEVVKCMEQSGLTCRSQKTAIRIFVLWKYYVTYGSRNENFFTSKGPILNKSWFSGCFSNGAQAEFHSSAVSFQESLTVKQNYALWGGPSSENDASEWNVRRYNIQRNTLFIFLHENFKCLCNIRNNENITLISLYYHYTKR